MAINPSDVRIMRSERLTDENDGGGQMTGIAIESGDINNLWDDVSRSMMAFGGVSLRKLYCAIRSANVDKFLGAHAILLSDAAAQNVSTLLFSTGDHYDERVSAQDRIEQFVVLSTRSSLRPVGTQRQGQTSLVLYADRENAAPEVGAVLYLKSPAGDQPVKVTKVTYERAQFTYVHNNDYRTYDAWQFVIAISQPLQRDFIGVDPTPIAQHQTEIFTTQSNNSARYYGIKKLTQPAGAGDRSVVVDGIFSPVIPAATTEQTLLDQRPGITQRVVQATSSTAHSVALGTITGAQSITLPTAWMQGSLRVNVGGSIYVEEGETLKLLEGSPFVAASQLQALDGRVNFTVSGSRAVTLEYLPGVSVELVPYTESVTITAGNRQLSYTAQLQPKPLPGSVRVEFAYLGNWYVVIDNGTGELSGAGASGTVNYSTGSVSITLPSEPDLNSRIIYTWAQSPYRDVATGAHDVFLMLDLPHRPNAGTVSCSWSRIGSGYTSSANAGDQLTGAADGYVQGNRVYFRSANMPSAGTNITVTYEYTDANEFHDDQVAVSARSSGTLSMSVESGLLPESVSFDLVLSWTVTTNVSGVITSTRFRRVVTFYGRANGSLVAEGFVGAVGSINGTNNTVNVNVDALDVTVTEYVKNGGVLGGWTQTTHTKKMTVDAQTVDISYFAEGETESESITLSTSVLSLRSKCAPDPMIPASLILRVGGNDLIDRGDGYLYRSWSLTTGAGVQCGTVDYVNGVVEIPYEPMVSLLASGIGASIRCGMCGIGAAASVVSVVFRSVASPLRPSGLQFLARRASDGALMRASSDNNGDITGVFDAGDTVSSFPQPGVRNGYSIPFVPETTGSGEAVGAVDYATGVVEITFSQPVILSSLTYNAVTYTTVPLSPDVLGLNPVRLPTNGRVPVFQPGYLVVIHNTKKITLNSPTAGQAIDCERGNLAQVVIRDAANVDLDVAMYSVNKSTGIITLADPFTAQDADENSLTMPLTVSHRIEDMAALGSVLVDGTLSLLTTLRNDYDTADTYVSAAVNFGTLQARVRNIFDSQTDTGWSDARSGAEATATYDALNYPVLVDNRSCVRERWKLRFSSTIGFQIIGEKLGIIGTGSTSADCSPINPMTGEPYFTIKKEGWGSGWVTSNMLRFNTDAAAAPVWAIRTVLPDSTPLIDDVIEVEFRGDAD